MKIFKRISGILLIICMLLTITSGIASADSEDSDAKMVTLKFQGERCYDDAYALLDRINAYRSAAELHALTMDTNLLEGSMQRAAEMIVRYDRSRPNGMEFNSIYPEGYDCAGYIVTVSSSVDDFFNAIKDHSAMINEKTASVGVGCYNLNGMKMWLVRYSCSNAVPPENRLSNTVVTTSVETLPELVNISCSLTETGKNCYTVNANHRDAVLNYDVPLTVDTVSYVTNNSDVISISDGNTVEVLKSGTAEIIGYIDGVKAVEFTYDFEYSTDVALVMGDANGDGEVSNSDLVAMARYVVGLTSDIDITAADIDKNGEITNTDLIAVARFIVGLA